MRLIIIFFLVIFSQCNSPNSTSNLTYLDSLSFLIQKDSSDFKVLSQRAKFYLDNNNIQSAKSDIDQAYSVFKNDINVLLIKGDIYFELNETRISKKSWERCLSVDPNKIECRIKLTNLLCAVRDTSCRSMIDTLAQLQNGIVSTSIIVYLKEMKEYDLALRLLNNLLEEDTVDKEVLYLTSLIYSDTTSTNRFFDSELSEKYFKEIIARYPSDSQVYYNFGKHKQNMSQFSLALDLYNKGIKLNPNSMQTYYNMGFCELELNNYPQAINHFSSAISIDNSFLIAYHARAYAYTLNGDYKQAQSDWKNCLMINPSYIPAIEGLSSR
ncbi:MAG: tetratricopeptide repeat protein [Flavobacteriales bacterium TMED191]|nr:MAG: tetratricopeptide repeat protein [Flavobacteriales bacterium TMED191]|tara:strand:- start:1313 stop:2290 length:978 start_codon:yes stop_codon:yes gene_type:complete